MPLLHHFLQRLEKSLKKSQAMQRKQQQRMPKNQRQYGKVE